MGKLYFAMGLHFHQPVGNFEAILERAYQNCYRPFLEAFGKYPEIKMTFHISGNLLDYFEGTHPEFLDRVKGFVDSGRLEIMGGGYYEPIFQAIPKRDTLGQIEMLSGYCQRRFGVKPLGMWMPERVWSPELVEDFQGCGIRYSILDDIHLIKAGVKEDEIFGYFMTGDGDKKMAIFPTPKILRYSIPFKASREIISYFRKTLGAKNSCLGTYGDDAEKFGEWPWTHNWVYKRGWLNSFFRELVRNRDWIETVRFSEYMDSNPPLKELRIPEASYEEMLEWSGGRWMNFLSKYPESAQMHARMSYVSNRISKLDPGLEGAQRELYKGQCNCPYWHGVFGGIYLYHLRSAVYEHLINADKMLDEDKIDSKDIDFFYTNGRQAVILEDKSFFICVDPTHGGVIREIDYKANSINLINTLARHREDYHRKILERINNKITEPLKIYEAIKTIDERIKEGIFYDRYMRACLIDHFIKRDLSMEDFANASYVDLGDFAGSPYEARIEKEKISLSREGKVEAKDLLISKEICISSDKEIGISYVLKNRSSSTIETLFGIEFNITMPYADSDRYTHVSGKDSFLIKDSQAGLGLELVFSKGPEKIWHFPVMTVSQSERAYSLNYQSSCIFPMWGVKLDRGEEIGLDIGWRMR